MLHGLRHGNFTEVLRITDTEAPTVLVLSRKRNESIEFTIGGELVVVHVAVIRGDRVQLACDAPPSVRIDRSEIAGLRRAEAARCGLA